jgi:hypothetical protein
MCQPVPKIFLSKIRITSTLEYSYHSLVPTLFIWCDILIVMASQPSQSSQHPLKRRRAVTALERRNIRQHHTEHPGTQQGLISWFNAQTGHLLNQTQISKILSLKYSHLDDNTQPTSHL